MLVCVHAQSSAAPDRYGTGCSKLVVLTGGTIQYRAKIKPYLIESYVNVSFSNNFEFNLIAFCFCCYKYIYEDPVKICSGQYEQTDSMRGVAGVS
jgi:hypothetical protein